MMTNLHVLIIGGGVGGLCLAQGLKQSEISVAVYERDRSVHFRYQGYRIHINTDGSRALHDCLPENLFSLFVATSSKPTTGRFTIFDPQLKERFSMPLPRAVADPSFLLITDVNRLTLCEILLAGLEGIVHFDKTFERFEQMDGGQVCAYFADGASATGDLLIGADGSNSVIRKLIVPDAKLADTGRVIYGKTPLTPETMQWIPDSWVNGFSRAAGPDGVAMGAGAYRKREPFAEAAAKYAPSLHLSETQDYLMWTLNVSLEQLAMSDEQFRDADLLVLIAYLILSIATTATMKMAKLAAQKLTHPAVPPTRTRQRTPNAISVTIAIAKVIRRSIFLLSRGCGYTFPTGPSLRSCS
jgi:hypothetical protein